MKIRYFLIAAIVLISIGFFVMMGGLLYDVAFAGIPYQDPPPALAAEYAANARIATTLFMIGGGIASLGALAALVLAGLVVRQLLKKNDSEQPLP